MRKSIGLLFISFVLIGSSSNLFSQSKLIHKEELSWEINSRLRLLSSKLKYSGLRTVTTKEFYWAFDSTNYPVIDKLRNIKFQELVLGLEGNVPIEYLSGFTELGELRNNVDWELFDSDDFGYDKGYVSLSKKISSSVKFINILIDAFHDDNRIDYRKALAVNEELRYRFNHVKSLGKPALKDGFEKTQNPDNSTSVEMKNRNFENLFYLLQTSVSKTETRRIESCRDLYYFLIFFEMYFNSKSLQWEMIGQRNSRLDSLLTNLKFLSIDLKNKADSVETLSEKKVPPPKKVSITENTSIEKPSNVIKKDTIVQETRKIDSAKQKAPSTIEEAFINTIWNTRIRYLILIIIAVVLGAFAVWKTLPDTVKEKMISSKSRKENETKIIYELLQMMQSQKSLIKIRQYESGSTDKNEISNLSNQLVTLSNSFTDILIKLSPQSKSRRNLERIHSLIVDLNGHLNKILYNKQKKGTLLGNNLPLIWREINFSLAKEIRDLNNNYSIKFDDFISALENS